MAMERETRPCTEYLTCRPCSDPLRLPDSALQERGAHLTFLRSCSPLLPILSTCTHSISSCMPHHLSLAYFSQHASMPPHHPICMRKTHLNMPLCIIKKHMQHACMGIFTLL